LNKELCAWDGRKAIRATGRQAKKDEIVKRKMLVFVPSLLQPGFGLSDAGTQRPPPLFIYLYLKIKSYQLLKFVTPNFFIIRLCKLLKVGEQGSAKFSGCSHANSK
jgi:hypothetical protein